MAAVLDWRLTALTPTEPGPLPWLPSIPATLQADPVWGAYLAKRSQLVADLADQIQDHLCRDAGEPAWVPPGSHPDTALIGEIAVWRAANGINPHDPRPIGEGGQLDTAAALWKQRLDRDIARSTDSSGNDGLDERQPAHTARSRSHHSPRRPYRTPGQRPNGPGHPAANPGRAARLLRCRSPNAVIHSARLSNWPLSRSWSAASLCSTMAPRVSKSTTCAGSVLSLRTSNRAIPSRWRCGGCSPGSPRGKNPHISGI